MTLGHSFHSACGTDFLGLRRGRRGESEIVYDNGQAQRLVWRVIDELSDDLPVREALQRAVEEVRVLPALFTELRNRAISIEAVHA